MKHRGKIVTTAILTVAVAGAWAWHRQSVGALAETVTVPLGYHVRIHRPLGFSNEVLIYDITAIDGSARRVDAIHALVAAAEQLQGDAFERVVLARSGQSRFWLDAHYVRQLGRERPYQNGVYTVRTFPSHLRRMDGSEPWPAPRGGWLGALSEEMNNVNAFLDEWLRP